MADAFFELAFATWLPLPYVSTKISIRDALRSLGVLCYLFGSVLFYTLFVAAFLVSRRNDG